MKKLRIYLETVDATWQQQAAETSARRSNSRLSETGPQGLENQGGLSSSFAGGNSHVPHKNQKSESRIRCKILNHFTKLGMPNYR